MPFRINLAPMKKMLGILALFPLLLYGQRDLSLAVVQYGGGGDWYANPTALSNLSAFCNKVLGTQLLENPPAVHVGSPQLFNYPVVHLTGHGNVLFSDADAENLRNYLNAGGFLHADDNYGMKESFMREMQKVYPAGQWVPLSRQHPLFKAPFAFPDGLPKIHEHDGEPPQALALYHGNRMVVLLTLETDLGDGWEDPAVHNDPEEIRQKALKMGANIVQFAFNGAYDVF